MNLRPDDRQARREARWQALAQHKTLAASLLWPLSLIHAMLGRLRRLAFALGWFQIHRMPVPVIVVGNVVVGGAGKTPTVVALVKHLQSHGWHPGVVSRGYGRQTEQLQQVDATTPASAVGDEPALIHQSTGAPVCVAPRRVDAARALLERHPDIDVLLCDDGLQHLALGRDLSIAVFDERGIGNGWQLPAGLLREPWPPAPGHPAPPDLVLLQRREEALPITLPMGDVPQFLAARRLADSASNLAGQTQPLSTLQGQALCAVAGIARPDAFFTMLRARGLTLARTVPLPDHAASDAYAGLLASPEHPLICTEKDAVKLDALLGDASTKRQQVWVVSLELHPEPGFFDAVDMALAHVQRRPAAAR
ncbi:tetraacyldisaccharide 4'-kinase [Hydrogenophaga sp.]|uniref:tetraacyldisaccharide 4'-kinase n=1 Tax=Hydrogenophaga sp. TaxID=1904254 RepID=UPI0025B8EC99|nr:tetraacyldisaccharide 4'-kinase [Hydrogenophaga sp.]